MYLEEIASDEWHTFPGTASLAYEKFLKCYHYLPSV